MAGDESGRPTATKGRPSRLSRALALATDAGEIIGAWLLLLAAENLVVVVRFGHYLAGPWEASTIRRLATPATLGFLLPLAFLAAALGRLARRSPADALARRFGTAVLFVAGAVVGYGVSQGRHMESWGVRGPFVGAVALAGAFFGAVVLPRFAAFAARAPRTVSALAIPTACASWCVDALVLPRLYPAFHHAVLAVTLASTALLPLLWRRNDDLRASRAVGAAGLVAALAAALWAPTAARRLRTADNVRLLLVERAPLLGRGVLLAARVAPPAVFDEDATRPAGPGEIPRALDWTGRDIVLLTVDALRADHVSAYGYRRRTTPNIDALAARGALFEQAYCPTPHTSYSVTSLMTGKYLRPLLQLGVGADSETWPDYLRRYGYRTAAFYPPAVFFIDEDRFTGFRERALDFEYRKVEFADPELRATQVEEYLRASARTKALFLWVHFFEPHEPYVVHAAHRFDGTTDLDAYDSEIAAADEGIGKIIERVRALRGEPVVIVTADHGEEFGEHGGRYHGTTVYEEQVHVPMLIVGKGVRPGRVGAVVQTIDLLPTVLSALGIPRPPRVRGRDLGPMLASGVTDEGSAFAETDDYTLLAKGPDRLVCARKLGACTLYRPKDDPREQRDLGPTEPARMAMLRRESQAIARSHGHFEQGPAGELPESLRRGLLGDAEAADDAAVLLDDANVEYRRKAAEVAFMLHATSTVPVLRRTLARDEDTEVRRFVALALVRGGEAPSPIAHALRGDGDVAWRRRAALAFAERGDATAADELVRQWREQAPPRGHLDLERAREILEALRRLRPRSAVSALGPSLEDVRLRPYVAETLGAIGDRTARPALLSAFAEERYKNARAREAHALVLLGAKDELLAPLTRFAGVPDPLPDALPIARAAGLLSAKNHGFSLASPSTTVAIEGPWPSGPVRLLVLVGADEGDFSGEWSLPSGTEALPRAVALGDVRIVELEIVPKGARKLVLSSPRGVLAGWMVPRADELPPPPPKPWQDAPR